AKRRRHGQSRAGSTPKKRGATSAAAGVPGERGEPMNCQDLIKVMAEKGYWTSPGGKTPAATLYTVVTMLPKVAPRGGISKRARGNSIGDSDLLLLDLDAFHEAPNDLPARLEVGLIQPLANLPGKIMQLSK